MWRNWNGYNPVALRGEANRLRGDLFGPADAASGAMQVFPALNVWEDADALFIEAEVPGLKTEDLEISVIGRQLQVKGRRADFEQQGVSYHRRERGAGEFMRRVDFPFDVNAEGVAARLSDGVLLIMLPKAEAAKPRKITVRS